MRIEFFPRQGAEPLEQLADGLIFLSGGIFQLLEHVGAAADAHGFGGKVRLEVWTHKVDGLTESDFVLAAKADQALAHA